MTYCNRRTENQRMMMLMTLEDFRPSLYCR